MPIIRVALNVPVDTLFDYQADDASEHDIGLRVCVPFGNKRATGIIVTISNETQVSIDKLKTAHNIFREIDPLTPALLDLFRFSSHYYHYPIGMVIMNGLPALLRNNKAVKFKDSAPTQWRLTDLGKAITADSIPARNRIARRLLSEFHTASALTREQIKQISPRAVPLLAKWRESGWIAENPQKIARQNTAKPPELTAEQAAAVTAVTNDFARFQTWLLHGITGSGKTEVYLRLIDYALAEEKQALILIPEINLTPQLVAIFSARFPDVLLINLHSGCNDSERLTGWLKAQHGEAKIILGTRLAVFTPMRNLGLIIVDEEHDNSFKQQDGLRYSARDLAIFRARQSNIPVILGSATPSLESYFNATTHRYRYLGLTTRAVQNATLPEIICIDTRHHKILDGFTPPLLEALEKCLAKKHQSLIFINRRGYAPILLCKSCLWTANCHRCSSRLVVHLKDKKLSCHHCGHQEPFPHACPKCGNQDIMPFGQGTQRIEETLATHFPSARVLRIDRDSIRRKNAWQEILQAIHSHQVDILVGTQLLAKGHDFPNLSLVGILNADHSLYSTDFRASERLFAQLMQVSGRAGRANIPGQVLIQTEFPNHPLYYALQRHDYNTLAQTLLTERKIAGFPPFVYQAILHAEAHNLKTALEFLRQAKSLAPLSQAIELFDPVPAQFLRLKGMERAHLLIQSHSRKQLQSFLADWHTKIAALSHRKTRWMLDVDPLEF